jgi:hypothetical protein
LEASVSDIVERLRSVGKDYDFHDNAYIYEAADEIERLRAVLKEIAEHPGPHADEATFWRSERARAALPKG